MSNLDWKAIRDAYEGGTSSLSALEREFGVSRQAIKKRASKEKWVTPQLQVTVTGNKQKVINRDVNAAQKVILALKLRMKKLTYQEIADRCGYASAGACRNAIQRELQREILENVEELRREELMVLDRLHSSIWDQAIDEDNDRQLWVHDRIIANQERRAKLMGLDTRPDENSNAPQVVVREVPVGWLQLPQTAEASHE